jgi:hypothetical protein
MLFHGANESDIKQRQAAYELERRHRFWERLILLIFAGLSAPAALASAFAAVVSMLGHQ